MLQQQEELSASVSILIDMHKFVQDSDLWENRLHSFSCSKNSYFFFGIPFQSWSEFIFLGIGCVETALVMPASGLLVELLYTLATTFQTESGFFSISFLFFFFFFPKAAKTKIAKRLCSVHCLGITAVELGISFQSYCPQCSRKQLHCGTQYFSPDFYCKDVASGS